MTQVASRDIAQQIDRSYNPYNENQSLAIRQLRGAQSSYCQRASSEKICPVSLTESKDEDARIGDDHKYFSFLHIPSAGVNPRFMTPESIAHLIATVKGDPMYEYPSMTFMAMRLEEIQRIPREILDTLTYEQAVNTEFVDSKFNEMINMWKTLPANEPAYRSPYALLFGLDVYERHGYYNVSPADLYEFKLADVGCMYIRKSSATNIILNAMADKDHPVESIGLTIFTITYVGKTKDIHGNDIINCSCCRFVNVNSVGIYHIDKFTDHNGRENILTNPAFLYEDPVTHEKHLIKNIPEFIKAQIIITDNIFSRHTKCFSCLTNLLITGRTNRDMTRLLSKEQLSKIIKVKK